MPASLDPLALVVAAKNRHYAYKPLSSSTSFGEGYTPSILQGRNITQNPAAAAALTAQGVHGANTPQVAARPSSPLNPVEPTANGQILPGFADGGEVITKVTKVIQDLIKRFGPAAVPETAPVAQSLRSTLVSPQELEPLKGRDPSLDKLIQGYQIAHANGDVPDDFRSALANKLQSMSTSQPVMPNAQERMRRVASQTDPNSGVDPYNTANAIPAQQQNDQALASAVGHASGGPVEDSSLKWIADTARKLGISSMAEDRARVATGIAKQFYGLDENGNPVLGGRAWLSSQHGTPPRILDELTSIPGGLAKLANVVSGHPHPSANTTPEEREWMSQELTSPAWSDEASARLDALDKRVKEVTGVGDAQTLPEHIEDAAGMLATPLPASKVAKEAPMLQRALEYMAPVRPPTAARYATDSTALGGLGYGLDELTKKLAAHKAAPEAVDPLFEQAAMDTTNAPQMAEGGKILDLTERLAQLAKKVREPPMQPGTVTQLPTSQISSGVGDFASDLHNQVQQRAAQEKTGLDALGHQFQIGDTVAGDKGNYIVRGLAGTKALPEDVERLKAGESLRDINKERAQRPWGPAYFVENPDTGDKFTMAEWGIKHSFAGPQQVPSEDEIGNRIQKIHNEVFGASDEPNWVATHRLLTSIPGHEDVMPHYAAMKQAFNATDIPPEQEMNHVENVLHPATNRFQQALNDLAAKYGFVPTDPNE
jgi:hypothetical protein